MEIVFMWKDDASNAGECAALYRAPGGYVVQGDSVDDHTRRQLRDFGAGEGAVFVPANVIDRLRGYAWSRWAGRALWSRTGRRIRKR